MMGPRSGQRRRAEGLRRRCCATWTVSAQFVILEASEDGAGEGWSPTPCVILRLRPKNARLAAFARGNAGGVGSAAKCRTRVDIRRARYARGVARRPVGGREGVIAESLRRGRALRSFSLATWRSPVASCQLPVAVWTGLSQSHLAVGVEPRLRFSCQSALRLRSRSGVAVDNFASRAASKSQFFTPKQFRCLLSIFTRFPPPLPN